MPGEKAKDESRIGEERLRVAMFIPVLDQLTMQLNERFGDEETGLLKEMSLFSTGALKSGNGISSSDIPILSKTYGQIRRQWCENTETFVSHSTA
jgi:hypothetical protein